MQTLLALQSCFAGPRPTQTDFNALFWRQKWRVLLTVLLNKIFESFTGRVHFSMAKADFGSKWLFTSTRRPDKNWMPTRKFFTCPLPFNIVLIDQESAIGSGVGVFNCEGIHACFLISLHVFLCSPSSAVFCASMLQAACCNSKASNVQAGHACPLLDTAVLDACDHLWKLTHASIADAWHWGFQCARNTCAWANHLATCFGNNLIYGPTMGIVFVDDQ